MPDPCLTKGYSVFVGLAGAAITITFSVFLGKRSAKSAASHPANAEPSYKTAATLAGYYDSEGTFLGGAPRWNDWTDDSYSCLTASENGTYCVEWSSERYYSGAAVDYLLGTCWCTRPQHQTENSTAANSTLDWPDKGAHACTSWSCDETRYTQVCACTAYETRTSCTTTPTPTPPSRGRRRRPRTLTPTPTHGTPKPTPNNDDDDNYDDDNFRRRLNEEEEKDEEEEEEEEEEDVDAAAKKNTQCSTYQVCVATSCWFEETKLYTACDCDPDGEKELSNGATWWLEYLYCQDWRCTQGTGLITLDDGESSLIYSSANGTRTYVRVPRELDYSCSTEGGLPGGGSWCKDWRGMTSVPGNVVEQLCECNINNSTVDGAEGYCLDWSCTTYFMTRCPGCSVVKGALLGALVLFAMAPLVVAWFMGNRQGQYAAPTGVAASILLAVYLGGVALIWTVLLPTAVAIVILGRFFAKQKLRGKVNPST